MCSRTESVEDLYIAGKFDPTKIRCNKNALAEAKRLEEKSLTNSPNNQNSDELLGFGFVNIRSLNKNLEHLEVDNIMLQKDIVFVTETWRDPKSFKTYSLEGYHHSAFADGKTGKGKGVGVFYKCHANIEVCEEDLFQFIKLKHQMATIFCLYVSKGCNFSQLVQTLKDYGFNNQGENTYLIGDLNFDYPGKNELSKYLTNSRFNQMVRRATHLDGHILDHVYAPESHANMVKIQHHYVYYSDHDGVLVSLEKKQSE